MEYHAVVVTALRQLCKVLAGLPVWKCDTGLRSARNRGKEDILEEHGPNRALVGFHLDSFPGPQILVLAYCVEGGGQPRPGRELTSHKTNSHSDSVTSMAHVVQYILQGRSR